MGVMTESVFKPKKRRVLDLDTGQYLELEEMQSMGNSNVIYKLTHIPTGKVYIGGTSYPLKNRLNCHHAIGKKAIEFSIEILHEVKERRKYSRTEHEKFMKCLEAFEIENHDSHVCGLNRKLREEYAIEGAKMLGYWPIEGVHPSQQQN